MKIRNSIECYILKKSSNSVKCYDVLLMHKPENKVHPPFYQPITGGIENAEMPIDACIREVHEETGIFLLKNKVKQLDYNYEFYTKPKDMYVRKNLFLVFIKEEPLVTISDEHDGYMWTNIEKVNALLYWDSNKTALKKIMETVFHGN